MPRALLLLAILLTFAGPSRGVDLLTNHIGFTVNDPAGLDWKQFKGNIGAFDDTPLHFYSQQTGSSFTGWATYFRLAKVDGGTTLSYFSVTPSQITVSGTNINLVIPRTNVPPENTYLAELWATNGPNARTLARGKFTVTYSLYNDSTFAPVVLSSAYLPLAGGTMTGPVTNQHGYYGNGGGLTNITATAVLDAGEVETIVASNYMSGAQITNALAVYVPSNSVAAMIATATNGLGAGAILAVTNDGAGIVTTANAGGPTVTVGVAASAIIAIGASNFYSAANGAAASNLAAGLVGPLADVSGRVVNAENVLAGGSNNWDTAYSWGNHAGIYLPLTGGDIDAGGAQYAVSIVGDIPSLRLGPGSMSPPSILFTDYTGTGTLSVLGTDITINGSKAWYEGNDGTGSGLDADLWRGIAGPTSNGIAAQVLASTGAGATYWTAAGGAGGWVGTAESALNMAGYAITNLPSITYAVTSGQWVAWNGTNPVTQWWLNAGGAVTNVVRRRNGVDYSEAAP